MGEETGSCGPHTFQSAPKLVAFGERRTDGEAPVAPRLAPGPRRPGFRAEPGHYRLAKPLPDEA